MAKDLLTKSSIVCSSIFVSPCPGTSTQCVCSLKIRTYIGVGMVGVLHHMTDVNLVDFSTGAVVR